MGRDTGSDLIPATPAAMPTCQAFEYTLADMPYGWLPYARPEDQVDPASLPIPSVGILDAMEQELLRSLLPCTPKQAAAAAAALLASYPQRESDSRLYAQAVAERLQECPPDLLRQVVNKLIDQEMDFRPSAGRVAQAVRNVRAERALRLNKVQGARRWREWADKEAAREAQVAADRAAAEARRLLGQPLLKTVQGATAVPQSAAEPAEKPKPKARPKHLPADDPRRQRLRNGS